VITKFIDNLDERSAAANPRAALAARRGIFVRRRFSSKGRTVRAAETSSEVYGF
jgi:hypothetical protein